MKNNTCDNQSKTEVSKEEWFQYFKSLNSNSINSNSELESKLQILEEQKNFSELDNCIKEKEVSDAILSLRNKKSSSFDSILNEMLKCGHTFLLHCITKLFNKVLIYGSFPKLWSKGFIVPLFKSGSKDDPAIYRGICIGSCLGKLFLKVLNNRLENFISKRNLKCDEQIGFCRGKRTSDHMFILKTLIEKYTKQGVKHLYTCFIGFKKAFDKVWHIGLFFKLREMGVSDLFYNVLKNMYLNTELCVKASPDTLTDFFPQRLVFAKMTILAPPYLKYLLTTFQAFLRKAAHQLAY